MGDWDVLVAQATTNLITNPGFEKATTGWTANGGGALARVTTAPVFGLYCLRCTPGAGELIGCYWSGLSFTSGVTYTASVYVKGAAGVPYRLRFATAAGVPVGTATTFIGDGTWHRHEVTWLCDSTAGYLLFVAKNDSVSVAAYYIDGAQVEVGPVATSYCDGSLPAPIGFTKSSCTWVGTTHASTSSRVATTRAGGRLYNLENTYHFRVLQILGAAAPPVENYTTPYALLDGSNYEHTRIAERSFTLNGVVVGTSWLTLQQYRAALYAAVQPANNEPVILRYTGGARTVEISAYYDGGLDGGTVKAFTEEIALRFLATAPNWREVIV